MTANRFQTIVLMFACLILSLRCSGSGSDSNTDGGTDADSDSDSDSDADADSDGDTDTDGDADTDTDGDVDADSDVSEDPTMGPGTENPYDTKNNDNEGVNTNDDGWLILESELARDRNNLWVSNSGENTVSNVDTEAIKEVGRYHSGLDEGSDPSRTSVDLAGDVFVGNRGDGSVTKISGSTSRCIDRDKNGSIETSTGAIPLPRAVANDPNGVPMGQSTDECVLWTKHIEGCEGPRGVAATSETGTNFEFNGHVWIGCRDSQTIYKLNGKTGDILVSHGPYDGNDGKEDVAPYGFVLDKAEKNRLWISGKGGGVPAVYWMDTTNGTVTKAVDGAGISPEPYGIAMDDNSHVWITPNGEGEVWRFKPDEKIWESVLVGPDGTKFKGIAVDVDGFVWPVINSKPASGVYFVDPGTFPDPSSVHGPFGFSDGTNAPESGTGVAIDFSGHVWGVSSKGCTDGEKNGCASRLVVDRSGAIPSVAQTPDNVQVGEATYSYSDMIGYSLLNFTTKEGWYRQRFAVCQGKSTDWQQISFESNTPETTNFIIRARTADTVADLQNEDWFMVVEVPDDVSPMDMPPDLPEGHFIELEVRLYTKTNGITPSVGAIEFTYDCTYDVVVE